MKLTVLIMSILCITSIGFADMTVVANNDKYTITTYKDTFESALDSEGKKVMIKKIERVESVSESELIEQKAEYQKKIDDIDAKLLKIKE